MTKGERLKCKFDALADEGRKTIDRLQQPPYSDALTPAQMEGLGRAGSRLDREHDRLKAEDFHLLVKKRGAHCQLVEKTGDGDGVCKPELGEECAEALGDGIGNDDGTCWPMKGKKREVCAQICDEEAVLQDEDNVDDDLAVELEGLYDDMTNHARQVNAALPEAAGLLSALESSGDQTEPCPLDTGGLSRTNSAIYALARGAAVGARGGADIAERLCDQQVIMNCAACCVPAEVLAGAFQAAWTAVELIEDSINAATLDAALACVASLKAAANADTAALKLIEDALSEVQASQGTIVDLLTSSQGHR